MLAAIYVWSLALQLAGLAGSARAVEGAWMHVD